MDNSQLSKLLSYFYLVSFLFIAFNTFSVFFKYFNSNSIIPLWPVSWIPLLGLKISTIIIFGFAIISTIYAFKYPSDYKSRILAFISLLLFVAFENSFGKINHYYHTWILVCFVFIFIDFKDKIKNNLKIFKCAQIFVLLTYTMSGIIKIINVFIDYSLGKITIINIYGPLIIIVKHLLETNNSTILGSFLISHPIITWLSYIAILLIELLSVFIILKPKYVKIWGILIIGLHISTYLVMQIIFLPAIILAFFLFIYPKINK